MEKSALSFWQRFRHWVRVYFRNACSDPECDGYMQMYDDRPERDWCSSCNRQEREIRRGEPT